MTLWIVLAAMAAFAAALVVVPLLRGGPARPSRAAHETEIYRDQLAELERDAERGLIPPDEAEAARAEIGRRMLAAAEASGGPEADATPDVRPAPRRSRLGPALAGLGVPAVAAALYLSLGAPQLPGRPSADGPRVAQSGADSSNEIEARVRSLASGLEKDPADLKSWVALADALTAQNRYDRAAFAWRQAARLSPGNAEFASLEGETLTFAAEGQVTPEARGAFEEALRRRPDEPRASFYLGVADLQAGQRRAALDRWLRLEATSPDGAPWLSRLRPRIDRLAADIGIDRDGLAKLRQAASADAPAAPRGPTREDVEAAAGMSAADRAEMIRGMVDRLAARLAENPDDADGWLRLGRARGVLGEKEKSTAAYARAAALRPDDVDVLVAWADSIVAAAEPAMPDTAQLQPVVDRILARAPDQPRALWLAGALALSADDTAGARRHWERLARLLDPDSVQFAELKRQLDKLPAR